MKLVSTHFLFTSFVCLFTLSITISTHAAQERDEDIMREILAQSKECPQHMKEAAVTCLGIKVAWTEQVLPAEAHSQLLAQAKDQEKDLHEALRRADHSNPLVQEKLGNLELALSMLFDNSCPLRVRQEISTALTNAGHYSELFYEPVVPGSALTYGTILENAKLMLEEKSVD